MYQNIVMSGYAVGNFGPLFIYFLAFMPQNHQNLFFSSFLTLWTYLGVNYLETKVCFHFC